MSVGVQYMHSHSGIERELRMEKRYVLVDTKFAHLFSQNGYNTIPFRHGKMNYIKAPIRAFVELGGVFKNLDV